MILAGFNIVATINYRAPGMSWTRLPLFVWSILVTSMLMVLAAPILVAGRTWPCSTAPRRPRCSTSTTAAARTCGRTCSGSSATRRSTSSRCPASASCSSSCRCSRASRLGLPLAVAGMLGVGLLSFFVWQHHLFDSGINPTCARSTCSRPSSSRSRPASSSCARGTLWRAKIRLTVPDAVHPRDALQLPDRRASPGCSCRTPPSDTDAHGSFFVMAHFHYTIMGGYIFAFFAGSTTGCRRCSAALQRPARQDPLLADVHRLQLDVPAAVRRRQLGHAPPGLRVRAAPADAQRLGVDLRVRPRALDAGLRLQPAQVDDHRRPHRRWRRTPGSPAGWSGRRPRRRRSTTSPRSPLVVSGPYEYGRSWS
jgi:hypothetical protein